MTRPSKTPSSTDTPRQSPQKLNGPWISDDNLQKAIRAVTTVPAASLIEASEKLYTTLTYGISLEQDRGDGKKSHDVRFFDFDDPKANELVVTRQFRVQGSKKNIRPDVVLFVNGIPLVVIECKEPSTLGEAWRSSRRSINARATRRWEERFKDPWPRKLFETMQILVATCGQAAVYGTTLTPHRFYVEWKTLHPKIVVDRARARGRNLTRRRSSSSGCSTREPRPRPELHRLRARRQDRADD